jgi:hypothetical protein
MKGDNLEQVGYIGGHFTGQFIATQQRLQVPVAEQCAYERDDATAATILASISTATTNPTYGYTTNVATIQPIRASHWPEQKIIQSTQFRLH